MTSLRPLSIPLFIISGMFLGVGFEHIGPDIGGYGFCFAPGAILMLLACFAFMESEDE